LPGTGYRTSAARAKGNRIADVPVVMLSARDLGEDRVAGLETGAVDHLTEPFSYVELSARVRVLLRPPSVETRLHGLRAA
jgi:DNA-binding response OmpR family regulator